LKNKVLFKIKFMHMPHPSALTHLAAIGMVTVITGLIYVSVQQSYRMGANDPQWQMAQDNALKLESGSSPEGWFPRDSLDIARSLAPFLCIVGPEGQTLRTSGWLEGKPPQFPGGVFHSARESQGNAITWQPRRGLRQALVIIPVHEGKGGYVVAGRLLMETERRIGNLSYTALLAWILCCGIIISHYILSAYLNRKTGI
jgi:hypothetical protein